MTTARKTTKPSAAKRTLDGGIQLTTTDTEFVATLPGGKQLTLPMVLDIEQFLALAETVEGIDDNASVFATIGAIRRMLPDDFIPQTRGVDVTLTLKIVMAWASELGTKMGKALT